MSKMDTYVLPFDAILDCKENSTASAPAKTRETTVEGGCADGNAPMEENGELSGEKETVEVKERS